MKLTENDFLDISKEFKVPVRNIKTFLAVESGGEGFDETTGKIIIQFEPSWFKRKAPYTPSGKWSLNGVERQRQEWIAFNDAFAKNPDAAMESTSIGIGQVMGFHFLKLGFKTVGEMWDYAKESEANQLRLSMRFIALNKKMFKSLISRNWEIFAYFYNGPKYEKFNYHNRLRAAFDSLKN